MNRILYIITIILASGLAAVAQERDRGVLIKNFRTEIAGETLDINFDLKATGLTLKCDGQLKVEFAVENDERRLVLPVVIYSGAQRYRYERRREELSGSYVAEPYHIYKGVKKDQTYELGYKLAVPYYSWMEHAKITFCEYVHDCSGDRLNGKGVLVADLNPAPAYVEPEVWAPNATLYPNLVSFLMPEVEEIKNRASMLSLNIGFPVNVTEVRPGFGENWRELGRADSLVQALQNNDLLDIHGVSIRGYASPEGRYEANERLARGRSQNFKKYLVNKYPTNGHIANAHTSWVPEDWEGVSRLLQDYSILGKQEILAIVNDSSIAPDTKDRMLQSIVWWSSNYGIILKELYPRLRRIELTVDYTVQQLNDNQARELLYTNPGLLSLEEIYRVARYYEPGSRQYLEVYAIAARQYPSDIIANNNAAAALLREGQADAALPFLEKTRESAYSLINYGTYWYISGDLEKAQEYWTKAKEAGIDQATHNLELIHTTNSK